MAAFNNITNAPISTGVRKTTAEFEANYEQVFGHQPARSNPRFYPQDEGQVEIECAVCERVFIGGEHRVKCKLCS